MLSILRSQCASAFKSTRLINLFSLIIEKSSETSNFKCIVALNRTIHFANSPKPNLDGPFPSRFHPGTAIEIAEAKIKELLSKNSFKTTEEWQDFKDQLTIEIELITELNFSSIVMNCLYMLNKLNTAHSFMKYLKETRIEANELTYLKYMALCGKNVELCGQEVVLQTFQKVKPLIDAAPVLDQTRATHIIQGISSTDQWRLSLDYLKKVPSNPVMEIKNCIAAAAIRNEDEKLAWKIIKTWLKTEDRPNDKVCKEYVLHSLKLLSKQPNKSELFLTQFLHYVQDKGFIMKEEEARLIEEYFKRHSTNWCISYTKVNKTGECNGCKKSLALMDLSAQEFRHLRDSFLDKSLKKTDLFINTTQREFEQFSNFIAYRAPFDVVMDGLNIAHTVEGIKNNTKLSQQLLNVVERFSKHSLKLLVLGRLHMKKWPQPIMQQIFKKATVFLTSNISQDDPFLVYAALASGPHSYVLSSDLMRDHIARLDDPNLIALFKRWQQTHQIYMMTDENKKLKFMDPLKYSINIQGSMTDGWHIPYDDKIVLDPYEELNNWLCIQKKL